MKYPSLIAAALAQILGLAPTTADAATHSVGLVGVTLYGPQGAAAADLASSTAAWAYNDVTGQLSQLGGTYVAAYTLGPTTILFEHLATGLVIGAGNAAAATTFACVEGDFGVNVGAHLCGNYTFGGDYTDDSTVSWGPGTAFGRTLGGDDAISGAQQSLLDFNGFTTVSWNGASLVMSNVPTPATSGFTMNFVALAPVPVPAAAWLFGSALGLLAWTGRKARRRR